MQHLIELSGSQCRDITFNTILNTLLLNKKFMTQVEVNVYVLMLKEFGSCRQVDDAIVKFNECEPKNVTFKPFCITVPARQLNKL